MVLKRINKSKFLFSGFWLVFIMVVVFFILLIGGLMIYSQEQSLQQLFSHQEFLFALRFTLWTSMVALIFVVLLGIPVAYILSRNGGIFFLVLETLLEIPLVLPPLISGVALLIFFGPMFGQPLSILGIDVVFKPLGVIIAQWFIALPYAIKIYQQAFDAIDRRMENLGRTLGLSKSGVFIQVTLPLAKKAIVGGTIMAWARALGEFGATAMLAGVTRMKTETLSVAVFLNMSIGDIEFAIRTAILMLLIALIILVTVKLISKTG